LDLTGNAVATFATGILSPVGLKVAEDGSLYYLARGSGGATGTVHRVSYGTALPGITAQPASRTAAPGSSVTFSVRASGTPPLRYQWQRNGIAIAGATAQDYTIATVVQADNGARLRAVVTNDFGTATSAEAVLTVSTNGAPTPTITQPAAGTLYSGGNIIAYGGTATDPEDGTLPASAFTWRVDFHHDAHVHPFMASTTGIRSGSFTVPATGETSANVWYRVFLTVRDSGGLTQTTYRDVLPRRVRLTLATSPAGLQVQLDGQPATTPISFDAVVGMVRTLDAPSPQPAGGTTYAFVSWSDGGTARHTISTPAASTTYTATFRATAAGAGTGLAATYFDTATFGGATLARRDATVDFTWGLGSPAAGIAADTFSVRWTGQVEAPFSGTYTFYTQSDDGVRLWVNGQPLVDNWTLHGSTENSGTIVLTAGQRYPIRMEFFENTGAATAKLLWSSTSIAKVVVPVTRLYPSSPIRVNFQPASAPVPSQYLVDAGLVYGSRGNGQTYGWTRDNTSLARDRNSSLSPDQRYDTMTHLQKPENPDAVWELAVPNGSYLVRAVAGDAAYFDGVFRTTVEGVLTVDGSPSTSARWVEGTSAVTVSDGRLTFRSGPGAVNNKLCFVEIWPR
jgi:hypothetical protein